MYRLFTTLLLSAVIVQPLQAQSANTSSPAQIRSADQLKADPGSSDSWTYRNQKVALSSYNAFIVDPTAVTSDTAAQWDGVTPDERRRYGAILADTLRNELAEYYTVADSPGPGVAKMRITLLGMKQTKAAIATASKVTPMGLAFTAVKSVAGKEGSFSGSAYVALEITDSRTGELLFAAIRRRAPDALDMEASLSTSKTVAAIARGIAKDVRKGLDQAHGR